MAGCVFRDTDNELKDYIERAEDVEEFWTGGLEEIAADSPWYFGVADPPAGWSKQSFLAEVSDITDDLMTISDSGCRAVATLEPPEKAVKCNTEFRSLICDFAKLNRDLNAAVQAGDLAALNSLALLSFEFDTWQAWLAEEFGYLQGQVN